MKPAVLDQSTEIIFKELKGIISEHDYLEYSAKKCENEKVTQTVFRTYNAEKSGRLALEQYTINSRAYGVVFNIYPKPGSGIPIFTFQLGGQIPDKVIFVLDIIPVIVADADAGLDIYKKKFGKLMASVIMSAAFGSGPALEAAEAGAKPEETSLPTENTSLGGGITWTKEAEQYLEETPKFVRSQIRKTPKIRPRNSGLRKLPRILSIG